MTVNAPQAAAQLGWRLAIHGDHHRARYFRERWQLVNPSRLDALTPPVVTLVALPVDQRGSLVAKLLTAGQAVLVEPPLAHSMTAARELLELAITHHAALRVVGLRRTEADYQAATAALASGRIGTPVAFRWQAAEYAVWADSAAATYRRGETFALAGPPLFDQLAGWLTEAPQMVRACEFPAEDGFAVDFAFASGCHARIEVRRMARATFRSGWMIEGTSGAYHHEKLITTTADGELVDEVVTVAAPHSDPVLELEAMSHVLPMSASDQQRAVLCVGLYEATARSLATGEPVAWDTL